MSTVAFEVNGNTPNVRFLASLSNGDTVVEDAPAGERHAWVRLQKWLAANDGVTITGLRLQNATTGQETVLPSNQCGYFVGKKVRKVFPGGQREYYGVGYYDGDEVVVRYHRMPGMDEVFTESKTKAKAGFMLICNE
jgi:hypothetical protein